MLGGTILVLPLIGIEAGYISIPIISIYFGLLSGYTTYLIVTHMGSAKTINIAIY